jgi:hypothetical protein
MTWVVAHKDLTLTDGSRRPHATGGVGVSAEEGSGVAPSLAAHTAHTFPFALAARARCWRAPPKKFEPGAPAPSRDPTIGACRDRVDGRAA